MKIYEHQGVVFNQTGKNDNKNISEKNTFQAIMDQLASSSDNKDKNVSDKMQMPFVNNTGIIFKEEPLNGSKEEALNSLKDTLDLVDFYADKLGDSSLSSDSLSSLVEQLEQRLNTLNEIGSSPDTNDRLKTIISDVTSTMSVEIERFKRGDYA